jgi:hypothetical protein
MRKFNAFLASVATAAMLSAASPASAGELSFLNFKDSTGLNMTSAQATNYWSALTAMGTTQFLGGSIGSFRLDESAMLAGAATLGVTEFDKFLRTGSLSSSSSGLGDVLTRRMTSGAGNDLQYLLGSFTSGGGMLNGVTSNFSNLTSFGGSTTGSASCDPEVANKLTQIGSGSVDSVMKAAQSDALGFSQLKNLRSSNGSGSGFSAMSCLDKLFQNVGTDMMFKPPSLGNLTNMLQNWTCSGAIGVAQQLAGAFGSGDMFKTSALGGFYPMMTMGEAMDGAISKRPGMGQTMVDTFGAGFANRTYASDSQIRSSASLNTLFR